MCAAFLLLSRGVLCFFLVSFKEQSGQFVAKSSGVKIRAEPLVFLLAPCKDVGRLSFARLILCSMSCHSVCKSTACRQRPSSCQQGRYSLAARPLRAPHKI